MMRMLYLVGPLVALLSLATAETASADVVGPCDTSGSTSEGGTYSIDVVIGNKVVQENVCKRKLSFSITVWDSDGNFEHSDNTEIFVDCDDDSSTSVSMCGVTFRIESQFPAQNFGQVTECEHINWVVLSS